MNYTFHWRPAFRALPEMLAGSLVTLQIAVLSMVIGIAIAVLLAVMTGSKSRWLRGIAGTWIEVARNTPPCSRSTSPISGWGRSASIWIATWRCSPGSPSTMRGIWPRRSGAAFGPMPQTQVRAARSLGFGPIAAFRLIVLPQLFRAVFHPMTNQMVWAILMTSLGVVVGVNTDLTGVTQELNVRTFRTFEYFAIAAVLYYLIAKVVTLGARLIAWRLFRY
ncbi:MAG: ABC transporter permease subunit [Geminicoccaceae bacterium]